jgi:hypothetical protein
MTTTANTMNSTERNRIKRDAEKAARKAANIAKVQETKQAKERTVWEKMADERKGISANAQTTDETSKKKKVRTQKVKSENRISHHRGHGKLSNHVHIKHGPKVRRVTRKEADTLVSDGVASYISKTTYKKLSNKAA